VGTGVISATSGVLTASPSGTITVIAGAAAAIRVETAANGSGTVVPLQNLTSGSTLTAFSITRDAAGNFVANAAGTWGFASTTGGVISGNLVAAGDNKSATMTGVLVGTGVISATSGVLTATPSGTITVIAGAAAAIRVETAANGSGTVVPLQNLTSGSTLTAFSITRDAAGNFVANAAGTWGFASTTGGVISGNLVAAGDNKSATMTGVLVGTGVISATSGVLTATPSGTITVIAGAASKLAIATQPSTTAQSGVAFATQPVIQIQDASGNVVLTDNATVVTAAIATGGAAIGGTLTATAVNGVVTFTSLKITGIIGARTLSFTSVPVLTAATSGTVTISAGVATQLAIATQPSTFASPTVVFSQQPVIQLQDASGNNVSQAGVNITVAIATGGGTLGGTTTVATLANGIATFTNLSIAGIDGNRTLQFTSSPLTAVTSNAINVISGLALNISSQTNVIAFGGTTGAVTVAPIGGTSPYQYKIGTGALQSSPTFSGLAAGTYTVTVSDANSVTSTVNVTITQPSALAVAITSQTNVTIFGAATGAVTVAGSGGTAPYQYKIGTGSLQSSPTFSGLAAGTYTVTVSDANSVTSTVNVTITQPSALAVAITSQTNVTIFGAATGAVTVAGSGGTAPYQYKIGTGALQSSTTFSGLTAGTYTITVVDAVSATSTVSVTITQQSSALVVTVSSQTGVAANGGALGSVTVAATGGTGPYQYKIGTGGLQSSPTFSGLAPGTYTITVTDANGGTSTVIVTIAQFSEAITFAPLPSKIYGDADFSPGANSNNNTIAIVYSSDNSAVATIINGNIHIVGAGAVNITASQAGDANNQAATSITRQLTVAKAQLTVKADSKSKQYGTANPALTITYSGFVNGEDVTKLTTPATATTTAATSTSPGNYPITASGAASNNYNFNYIAGSLTIIPLTNANLSNLTISSGTLSPTFASGTLAYAVSVGYDVNNITLTPTYDPTASATIYGTPVPNGSPSFGIGLNPGYNTITVIITAQDGVTKNSYTVTVYRATPPSAIVPTNFISPNGDGKNDGWVIKDIDLYPNNKVTVFDKAGRIIYSKRGYNNDWGGTLNGAPLVQGTYFYIIELGPGILPVIKGFITVLRSR